MSTGARLRFQFSTLLLTIGVMFPPIYVLAMIQYGAITVPYWDHLATAKQIIQFFDGTLSLTSLLEPQSQARPLIPRLIFIANAAATDWDIRSEYIYIILTVYGAFLTICFFYLTIIESWSDIRLNLVVFLLLSIFSFSPVGATNYNWSLMLIGTLSYFFTVITFTTISKFPTSRSGNIIAVICAWLSSFSISQGLLVFPVVIVLHQIIASNRIIVSRWSMFWFVNMIFCYAIYFPHLADNVPLPPHPNFWHFIIFIPVYLGSPLGSLLLFPDLPESWHSVTNTINLVCGVGVLGAGTVASMRIVAGRLKGPEALIMLSFFVYALACSILTAWGRANGPTPIYAANSSRYAIFASLLLIGLIIYHAKQYVNRLKGPKIVTQVGLGIFVTMAAVSYARSLPVYVSAHNDNLWLKDAYLPEAQQTANDARVYPDEAYLVPVRADLLRLGIGPYRLIPEVKENIFSLPFVGGIELQPKVLVRQRFRPGTLKIRAISFQVVSWGKRPSSYAVHWSVARIENGTVDVIETGSAEASSFSDWQSIRVRLSGARAEQELEVSIFAEGTELAANPIGVALYKAGPVDADPVLINGIPRGDGSRLGIVVTYAR